MDKVYVDVETGAVLEHHPQHQHARNRNTYSANNGTSLPGTLKRTEAQASTGDVAVDCAHDNAGHVYDFYKVLFNRDGINNAGMTICSVAHYSNNYCNAFWNNSCMVYGDGNASQNCGSLACALDVTAHEMTHGVTSSESNLTYSGESGGLNESLSDVFGGGVEAWVDAGKDTSPPIDFSLANDVFLIGDTVLPPFLRSMCDPVADGVSKDAWYLGLGSIDVHYSSGPNNLAFCLMSKGGTHPRGQTTINVPALGMEKALRLMYAVNVNLATSSTNYASWRNLMVIAAQQLGYSQADQDAIACAYAAIKVGTAPASCGGTPPPPATVLTNGVPVTGIADSVVGNMKLFTLDVPAGVASVTFQSSGGTGDADMYVQLNAAPTETTYLCRPYLSGNAETCTITNPAAGKYYVGLRVYSAYLGLTLTGTYGATPPPGCSDPVLTNGVGQVLSGASGSATYRCIPSVPAGKTLTVRISGGTGDADLYTRFGSRPTTTTYNCRPYLGGNTETCTTMTTTATAGNWFVMVRGFSAYSGVTLVGSY